MTKPELGTKRLCAGCNAKFYDLLKDPIVCPMCETVFVPPKPAPARSGRRAVEPMPVAVPVVAAPKVEDGDEVTAEKADDETEAEGGVELLEVEDEE